MNATGQTGQAVIRGGHPKSTRPDPGGHLQYSQTRGRAGADGLRDTHVASEFMAGARTDSSAGVGGVLRPQIVFIVFIGNPSEPLLGAGL